MGPNLGQLFKFCEKKFSNKTVSIIAIQMLERLEHLHDSGYLHRDLKPENIMIGQGKKAGIIHLIDFGLAKRYICPNTGKHVEHKKNKGVFGTTRYLSKNANSGCEQSRVDDLIALGHILVMLLRGGKLPWDME